MMATHKEKERYRMKRNHAIEMAWSDETGLFSDSGGELTFVNF